MRNAFETISVDDIIATYVEDRNDMWKLYGQKTVELLAEEARSLAMIWESAWKQGKNKIANLGPVDPDRLIALYEDKNWAKSTTLNEIGAVLVGGASGSAPAGRRKRRGK